MDSVAGSSKADSMLSSSFSYFPMVAKVELMEGDDDDSGAFSGAGFVSADSEEAGARGRRESLMVETSTSSSCSTHVESSRMGGANATGGSLNPPRRDDGTKSRSVSQSSSSTPTRGVALVPRDFAASEPKKRVIGPDIGAASPDEEAVVRIPRDSWMMSAFIRTLLFQKRGCIILFFYVLGACRHPQISGPAGFSVELGELGLV